MAEAAAPKKGLVGRLLLPLVLLLTGAGAGAGGAIFLPGLVPQSGAAKPEPKVAPLEYVEIDNSFTSNLKDTGRFVQLKIAVSTQGGPPVLEAVERHRLALIAVVLGILADSSEAELREPAGRELLTRRMRVAINDLLQRKSGIAGIDDVFLTSFVLQ